MLINPDTPVIITCLPWLHCLAIPQYALKPNNAGQIFWMVYLDDFGTVCIDVEGMQILTDEMMEDVDFQYTNAHVILAQTDELCARAAFIAAGKRLEDAEKQTETCKNGGRFIKTIS